MRTTLAIALASVCGLLSGCATTGTAADDIDYEKIALVNRWASRNNVEVRWVNPPRRYAKAATTD